MKREILRGEGIQGMRLTINVCDMFAANQVADELKKVFDNHCYIEQYKTTPYDMRKEAFPDGEPKRIELSDETILNLYRLMNKFSYASKSTLFTENDEEEEEHETLVKGGPGAWPTEPIVGESKNY